MTLIINKAFPEFPTRNDWQAIKNVVNQKYVPSMAASIIAHAHQLLDQDDIRHALVEATTAVELGIEEFLFNKPEDIYSIIKEMQSFRTISLRARVAVIASVMGKTSQEALRNALDAIDTRNDIVHEGRNPPNDDNMKQKIDCLLRIAASLLTGPTFKFPKNNPGNALSSPEEWERRDQEVVQRRLLMFGQI